MLFTMDVCRLLSLEEANLITETQSHLLRLLVPVLKLFTAKKVAKYCVDKIHSYTHNSMRMYQRFFQSLGCLCSIVFLSFVCTHTQCNVRTAHCTHVTTCVQCST